MEIININGTQAHCDANGIERDVDLFLLQDQNLSKGDFVMVHVGYAIQKIHAAEARTRWQLFDQMEQDSVKT